MRSLSSVIVSILASSVLATAVACGGASTSADKSGSATLTGSVGGTTFTAASALAQTSPAGSSCTGGADGGITCAGNGQEFLITLTDRAGVGCAQDSTATPLASADILTLIVVSDVGPVQPGTFTVYPPDATTPQGLTQGAISLFGTTTSTCQSENAVAGTSGTITLGEVSASHLSGSLDVTFGTSGHLAGPFEVDVCGEAQVVAVPEGGAGCQ
jgi:hypothetical protein